MNWCLAVEFMKACHKPVKRRDWSGDKYIFFVPGYKADAFPYSSCGYVMGENPKVRFVDQILIHTKDRKLGYYATTQCDMLADDWIEYKPKEDELQSEKT